MGGAIIPICFTFDDNYALPAAVAFWSLLDRTRVGVQWEMFVLHHDISLANQAFLKGIVEKSGKGHLQFVDTGDFLASEWECGSWDGHQSRHQFTRDTIMKCFPVHFFPQYDRIIYSDVDVVFADDVSELMEIDLEDAYLAGVFGGVFKNDDVRELDHFTAAQKTQMRGRYVAGGIWVQNLRKMREDGLERKMLEVISDNQVVKRWPDQDVMSIACEGKIVPLPLNYIAYPYLVARMRDVNFKSGYTREALFDSVLHPKIIHYAGRKPWKSAGVGYDENWWSIADYLGLDLTRPRQVASEDYDRARRKMIRYKHQVKFLLIALILSLVFLTLIVGA